MNALLGHCMNNLLTCTYILFILTTFKYQGGKINVFCKEYESLFYNGVPLKAGLRRRLDGEEKQAKDSGS
jgi:hypothetical protein